MESSGNALIPDTADLQAELDLARQESEQGLAAEQERKVIALQCNQVSQLANRVITYNAEEPRKDPSLTYFDNESGWANLSTDPESGNITQVQLVHRYNVVRGRHAGRYNFTTPTQAVIVNTRLRSKDSDAATKARPAAEFRQLPDPSELPDPIEQPVEYKEAAKDFAPSVKYLDQEIKPGDARWVEASKLLRPFKDKSAQALGNLSLSGDSMRQSSDETGSPATRRAAREEKTFAERERERLDKIQPANPNA